MNLRPAVATDRELLRRIHHLAYRDVVTRQFGAWDEVAQDGWFDQSLAEAEFSVVEDGGESVGAVGITELPERLFLAELQILPEHQGRGLGTAVLKTVLARASQIQKPIVLRVLHMNRACSLYERHGFVVTGQTETHNLMLWSPPNPRQTS